MLKKSDTALRSLDRLGFNQQDKLDHFLALPAHRDLLSKFEVVFPQATPPKFNTLTKTNESPDEVDFMADPNDKELDLTGGDELVLSDDGELAPTLPVDEGLSLDDNVDDGMGDLDAMAGLEGIESDGPPSMEGTLTGLKLGDDLEDLDSDVQAKLKEIDEIMEYDATRTQHRGPLDSADLDPLDASGSDLFEDSAVLDGMFNATATEDLSGDGAVLPSDEYEKSLVFDAEEDMGFSAMEESEIPVARPALKRPAPVPAAPVEDAAPDFSAEETGEEMMPMEESEVTFGSGPQSEAVPALPVAQAAKTPEGHRPQSRPAGQEEYREVVGHYNAELERLQATLNHLRSDREELLKKIDGYEEDKIHHQRQLLSLRAELDEKKIETQLMKKRMGEETQDLRYSLQLEQERRQIADEKLKAQQAEMAAVQQKIRMEVRKVSGHERELEQQLELLKSDAETQIRNRDLKILELKRRLDAMEFDVENMSAIEKKTLENKQELEVKLDKAIRTLRAAIGILEVDDPKVASLEKLKKNLDV